MAVLCKNLPTPLHKSKLLSIYLKAANLGLCITLCLFIVAIILLAIFYKTSFWFLYLPVIGLSAHFWVIFVLIINTYTCYNILKTDWGTPHLNKIKRKWGLLSMFLMNPLAAYIFIKIAINELKKSDQEFKEIVFSGTL